MLQKSGILIGYNDHADAAKKRHRFDAMMAESEHFNLCIIYKTLSAAKGKGDL